ncbi:toprim domain-containing protein [Gaoshiqia sediminis]|uniref:Toprim domain-containing protein n=1 Tax=Gaoshiqia sediminis TaxID=2986998 RepID=A0AA41YAT6_9BACT|nr:toprim domain-containing protein [Gaoshiqia sediminis]MCW0481197.1 toprim domain-containing protein [Gaoshiqia sediminis]
MRTEKSACETARKISIIEFLGKSGFAPAKENHKEAWYLSPLRSETHPSFKVSKLLNRWYDHGAGVGGNIIDLVIRLNNNCSVREALNILNGMIPSFSFQQQNPFAVLKPKDEIKIENVIPLKHPELISYLRSRKVDPSRAARYARQVYYSLKGSTYFAIGLQNVSGGWELRNPYYKNSSSPKNYSLFSKSKTMLSVTEGMFDFFSLLTLYPGLPLKSDFLILNSLSFAHRIKPVAESYSKTCLYLDNDMAGKKATQKLLEEVKGSVDLSGVYASKKDMNELLVTGPRRFCTHLR